MRIRKEHFEGLLDPVEARDIFASPLVVGCWIESGEIRVEENRYFAPRVLEEYPDMFLSFARLGGGVEPHADSIKRWVLKYGLPKRSGVLREVRRKGRDEPRDEPYMLLEDFREEARSACRLLKLYAEIRGEDIEAIFARLKNPQSSLDKQLKVAFDSTPHRTLLGAFGQLYYQEELNARARDEVRLFTSLRVLTDAVNEKAGHRSRLSAQSASTVIESWYCPDLLSAMYLQLHLLIADRRPMDYCEFCGTPFPYRGNKVYCNSTCRSNARHERERNA